MDPQGSKPNQATGQIHRGQLLFLDRFRQAPNRRLGCFKCRCGICGRIQVV